MHDVLSLLAMISALAVMASIAASKRDARRLVPIKVRRKF